jgi:SAM-dependent methyltransferase
MTGVAKTWVEFWDGEHAIYVNERHKKLHARAVARDIIRHIPSGDAVVLDHGCGEALYAIEVAAQCRRLFLCEAAQGLRQVLAQRMAMVPNVEVLDAGGVVGLADASLDLVVSNSMVQYLIREELSDVLALWRRKLKPTGTLVVADVIPADVGPLTDAIALVRFGWIGGFLFAALAGLVRTALSDYRKVRERLGISTYAEPEFLALLAQAGLRGERVRPNFGHNQARMAFRAVPL